MSINFTIAYLGGLVTFLAPCGAFLLPAFFACAFEDRSRLLQRILVFLGGLVIALVPLGFAAGGLGGWLLSHSHLLTLLVGVVITVLGIAQVLALPLPKLPLPRSLGGATRPSVIGIFLFGISYGLAGSGCTEHHSGGGTFSRYLNGFQFARSRADVLVRFGNVHPGCLAVSNLGFLNCPPAAPIPPASSKVFRASNHLGFLDIGISVHGGGRAVSNHRGY